MRVLGLACGVALGVAGAAVAQTASPGSGTAAERAMTPSMGMPQTPGAPAFDWNPGTVPVAPPNYGSAPSGDGSAAPAASGVTNPYVGGGPAASFGAAPPPIAAPAR